MKKNSATKLVLRKDIIAQLGKEARHLMGGNQKPLASLVPQLCYQDYTARSCGVNCPAGTATCHTVFCD